MHSEKKNRVSGGKAATPIDLAHLKRQTLGDAQLEREVLGLFMNEAAVACTELGNAHSRAEDRRQLAHRLSGSARAIGAFWLADSAAALEASPDSADAARALVADLERLQSVICERLAVPGPQGFG